MWCLGVGWFMGYGLNVVGVNLSILMSCKLIFHLFIRSHLGYCPAHKTTNSGGLQQRKKSATTNSRSRSLETSSWPFCNTKKIKFIFIWNLTQNLRTVGVGWVISIRFCVVFGGGVVYGLWVKCCWCKPFNIDELQTHFSFIYS